jgi:phosphate-selective porin OprO/OprP
VRTGVLVHCRSLSLGVISLLAAGFCCAQEPKADPPSVAGMVAGEADADIPERRRVRWNEFEGRFVTLRFGANFMYDFVSFSQDETSKQQIEVTPSALTIGFTRFAVERWPARHPAS